MKDNINDLEIVANEEEISFKRFMDRLFEIYRDCNQEVYYSEIFIPFLRMCAPTSIKIVPTYNDRKTGPKAEKCTDNEARMKTISAPKEDGSYVVPDFIYVPEAYTFEKPCKPILMVETKLPVFLKEGNCYRPLEAYLGDKRICSELKAEINACGHVIFTDGITWMFLKLDSNENIEKMCEPIKLVEEHEPYYKTYYITRKTNQKQVDLEPEEWNKLKGCIRDLVEKLNCKVKQDQ